MPMVTSAHTLTGVDWFKSSYSNDDNRLCLEGARLAGGAMAVRDSKHPQGPAFVLVGAVWTTFVHALNEGELNAR
ncbi:MULTISPECIES: DUF397 domain-containing protein [unclassified Streptomyces]|uniref:DUF397 domain-containing protein n=1 Tax=unclassified Streptomyces TaxID=2593676 RepID=UPI00381E4B69